MDFGYENEVLFPFTVQAAAPAKPGSVVLHAKVNWLVCREVCIPGKAELEQNVNVVSGASAVNLISPSDQVLWNRLANALPQALPSSDTAIFQPTPTGFRLAVTTGQRETQAAFFPEDEDILDNPAPQTVTPTATGLVLDLKKDANLTTNPAQLKGVLELAGGRNYEIAATPGTVAAPPAAPAFSFAALAGTVFFAFLGGLLLNLMPCVFPVLFLKGLALVQLRQRGAPQAPRARPRLHRGHSRLLLGAGCAAARAARRRGHAGLGIPIPVAGFSLADGRTVVLPRPFAGRAIRNRPHSDQRGRAWSQKLAAKQGYAGSFFTGVLAVIVATPCTAPFMGAAIGYALAQPAAVTFAIFTALALGLAAPYVALTLQPAWTRLLPKPGVWMDILKQAVSVPIFGTVIWLAWVVARCLWRELCCWRCSPSFCCSPSRDGSWAAGRRSVGRPLLLCLFCSRRLLPASPRPGNFDGAGRYIGTISSEGSAARSGAWQPWSADGVQRALAAGQPVFVDFTASWCLSCQVNERVALSQPEVMQAFGARNVVLFRADWTREDPAITQALTALGRSGVPVYALYVPGPERPTVVAAGAYARHRSGRHQQTPHWGCNPSQRGVRQNSSRLDGRRLARYAGSGPIAPIPRLSHVSNFPQSGGRLS